MINFFSKKLNKKGFTLAELLIVIAIIAILVAIALPIFANYLDGARIAVHESNARAIKAMAIKELLSPSKDTNDTYGPTGAQPGVLAQLLAKLAEEGGKVYATGTVNDGGEMKLTGLTLDGTTAGTAKLGVVSDGVAWHDVSEAGGVDVHQTLNYVVVIDATDVDYPTIGH